MPVAHLNGRRTHWRERGSGRVILFIHGFPFHCGMWEPQLAALPDGWRGVAPDLRGCGESDGTADPVYGMDAMADDLAALLDHLEVPDAVLCGLSMGGYIALAFHRRHGRRLRGLVLCDTRAAADSPTSRAARLDLAGRIPRDGRAVVSDALLPRLISERTRRRHPEVEDALRSMIEQTPLDTLVKATLGMAERLDATGLLPTIACPTLLLVGAEDAIAPAAEMEEMAGRIRGAGFHTLAGVGHVSNLEDPAGFNRAVYDFCATLPAVA